MRITCPNCGAQYEIDEAMVPTDGRDVQCSSCGHVWFQLPEGAETEAAAAAGAELPDPPAMQPQESADDEGFETRLREELASTSPPADTEDGDGAAGAEPGDAAGPKRRELDEDLLDILREEAQREAEARRREGGAVETQPDLGLPAGAPPPPGRGSRRPEGAGTGDEGGGSDGGEAMAGSVTRPDPPRRELPDVEEISSSLKPSAEHSEAARSEEEAASSARRYRAGFRIGFGLVVLVIGALMAVYAYAPQLAERFPEAEPALRAYVAGANEVRVRLDNGLQLAVDEMRALLARLTAEG